MVDIIQLLYENGNTLEKIKQSKRKHNATYFHIRGYTTELHAICANPNISLDIIEYLVEECGADPLAKNERGEPPLDLVYGNLYTTWEIIQYLFEFNLDATIDGAIGVLENASQSSYITAENFQLLLDNGAVIDKSNRDKLLHNICCNENVNLEIIKLLIETYRANPNATVCNDNYSFGEEKNALFCACCSKKTNLQTIAYLIGKGVRFLGRVVNSSREAASALLHFIIGNGNSQLDIIQYFVKYYYVDPNVVIFDGSSFSGRSLLHLACMTSNLTLDTLKYLLNQGGNLKKPDCSGDTPAHAFFDAYFGRTDKKPILNQEITQYLVEQDIDTEAVDDCYKQTILHCMCSIPQVNLSSFFSIIKKCHAATLIKKDSSNDTPLQLAYKCRNVNAVCMLLLDGREVGLNMFENKLNKTPHDLIAYQISELVDAAKRSKVDLMKILYAKGFLSELPFAQLSLLMQQNLLLTEHIDELKQRQVLSVKNFNKLPKSAQHNIVSILCCIKRINNNDAYPTYNGERKKLSLLW